MAFDDVISPVLGGGLVFWHPNGAMVRHIVETFWKDLHLQRGYNLVYSPHIAKLDLWKTSGHFDFYKENMYDQMAVSTSGCKERKYPETVAK